ncbi:amidohydrolase family protein [Acidithiobacillus sulfurivorans]|uniref:amidohydrolase family protein n=1 Tax=Acidithiobacillus sulfurivorans TaxID=1958756 RepID=UPI001C07DE4A|nr:amidohydrolase family protein [Acidithiobacillus sulfurivorans]
MIIKKLFRASILNPKGPGSSEFYDDGALYVENGLIKSIGKFDDIAQKNKDFELIELDGVVMPGFVDVHLHWVQHRVRGQYAGELLSWLKSYIWPEEARYINTNFAIAAAEQFYTDLLRAGTVMGMSYSSPHASATEIALQKMRGDWIIGNVLMAINAPDDLTDYSLHDPVLLKDFMARTDRIHYAVTPRFAPNLSAAALGMMGQIAAASDVFIQTHLAESRAELAWVKELFPDAAHYTEVYDRAGLLTKKTILGHCIEMCDAEWQCLAERGSWVAHCPTSNEALGNRRMPLEKLREYDIPFALATDIGGGPSHSMLHVMQRFLATHRAADIPVQVQEALYRGTLAGAEAMGRDSVAGNFMPGKRADFILMPAMDPHDSWVGWFESSLAGSISELEERPRGTWLSGEKIA